MPEPTIKLRIAAEMTHQGVDAAVTLSNFAAPGAFEIPLHAKKLAASDCFDTVIACGLIVNGSIYRHEFVYSAVAAYRLMRIQIDTGVPVFPAVLTRRDFHDYEEHRSFSTAHFVKKGEEVVSTCLAALCSLRELAVLTH